MNTLRPFTVLADEDAGEMIAITQHTISGARDAASDSIDERFAALVSRQSRFVFRVAYAVVRNIQDAEDVTQETFLRVYRTRSWNAMDEERAFLARVAWRIAIDRLSKQKPGPMPNDLADGAADPEQAAIAEDRNTAVRNLINALPEELRLPLSLSSVQELNSREIGRVMGIPEGTVRTRLFRARQILRQKLAAWMEKTDGER